MNLTELYVLPEIKQKMVSEFFDSLKILCTIILSKSFKTKSCHPILN